MATIYPIDSSTLNKGDSIPVSQLIEITKAQPSTARYAFRVMKLKSFITKSLAQRGLFVTIAIRKSALVILTDAEAEIYNTRFAQTGVRRIKRSTARHAAIDLSRLTPQQRLDWDRHQARLAMMVAGLKRAKELPTAEPHKRIQ